MSRHPNARERILLDISQVPSSPQRRAINSARTSTASTLKPFTAPLNANRRSLRNQSTGNPLFNQSQSNFPTAENPLVNDVTIVQPPKVKPTVSELESKLKTIEPVILDNEVNHGTIASCFEILNDVGAMVDDLGPLMTHIQDLLAKAIFSERISVSSDQTNSTIRVPWYQCYNELVKEV
jgi:hypothetical protein